MFSDQMLHGKNSEQIVYKCSVKKWIPSIYLSTYLTDLNVPSYIKTNFGGNQKAKNITLNLSWKSNRMKSGFSATQIVWITLWKNMFSFILIDHSPQYIFLRINNQESRNLCFLRMHSIEFLNNVKCHIQITQYINFPFFVIHSLWIKDTDLIDTVLHGCKINSQYNYLSSLNYSLVYLIRPNNCNANNFKIIDR